MKEYKRTQQIFNMLHRSIIIVAIIILLIFFIMYSHIYNYDAAIFSYVVPLFFLIFFLSYNSLLVHFHKKGFYTFGQAVEFYEKCRELNISLFQEENLEKSKDVYFSIFGTDEYLGNENLLVHLEEIYNVGRKITEK